jgi:uncharacterized protein YpuA (DUF1002 family)
VKREGKVLSKIPKKFLDKLQGKNVDTSKIESIANSVTKDDINNEQKLRQLIRQVAMIANVKLTKEKEDQIISYVKNNNLQGSDLKAISKLLKK